MAKHRMRLLVAGTLLGIAAPLVSASAATCESLLGLSLPDTTITLAESHAAGPFTPPGSTNPLQLPAFCRVAGVVNPAVRFEVWLPAASAWNGKFQGVGNGGLAGTISYSALAAGLVRNYATASTDTGHQVTSPDGIWALHNDQLIVDFAYRGTHEMSVKGKAITGAYYGAAPRLSYFVGCSKGGQQALMEAQRFPDDYDGIVAGDPAAYWTQHYLGGHLWPELAMLSDTSGAHYIPRAKLPALEAAVNAQCDALDGVVDGILGDPRRCRFDPSVLLCQGAETDACLTAPQIEALQAIYAGPGADIYPGILPGNETGWASWITGNLTFAGNPPVMSGTLPTHLTLGIPFFKYFIFDDPNWDYHTLNFTTDVATTMNKPVLVGNRYEPMSAVIDATNPDLHDFRSLGGKLIQYHGFSDPDITPLTSINYYESVVDVMGRAPNGHGDGLRETQSFYRLFMVPGMQHCSGGPGPTTFDALGALEQWVEEGVAPVSIPAAHVQGGVTTLTRPLCAYPLEAVYTGQGSTNDAANFVCQLRGLDRADEAAGFDHGQDGRNNARGRH